MSWLSMALGVDLGCLAVLLWLVVRAPLVEEDGAEPQRALLDPPERIPAPGYAVRALEAARPEVEVQVHDLARLAAERPALAPEWFSRRMWAEECRGREVMQTHELTNGQDHRLPREKRGAL